MERKEEIQAFFKINGLILQRSACNAVLEYVDGASTEERLVAMDKLLEQLQSQSMETAVVAEAVIAKAIGVCRNSKNGLGTEKILTIIDAFSIPKFKYDRERKKFLPTASDSRPTLYGHARSKASVYQDRYTLIHQRLLRHDLFQPPVEGRPVDQQGTKFQLNPIEFLTGYSRPGDMVIFGMLTQLKEGAYYLEDPTGSVKLDIPEAKFHTGLFTENSFILAEGNYEDEVFHVKGLGFPPTELAEITRTFFGNINFFGGTSIDSVKASDKLLEIERSNPHASFVFIADVWLDDPKVMNRLHLLMSGFSAYPPTCFFFLGNFTSAQQDCAKLNEVLSEAFRQFAEMVHEFPLLVSKSKFIFVPGPLDPGLTTILPRPPIPLSITEHIRQRLPGAVFTTNPCRIQYCTQEIVIFREDLVTKMCRNSVHFPKDGDVPNNFAKTLVSQGHLCPLPLHIAPVYWEFDHTLYLYPLPDLVVCADRYDPFTVTQSGCTFVNPSSFSRNDFVFKVYLPSTRQVEDSKVEAPEI